MRYKGTFSPSYLLGKPHRLESDYPLKFPDPESLEWCLFDETYKRELDKTPYVSLSRDRKQGPVATDENSQSQITATSASETTKERSTIFDDEQDLEFDEAPSDEEDAEIPEGSMFDYHIPGVLTKDKVKSLDLDHWRLVVRNNLVELEVSMSLSSLVKAVH